MPREYPRSRRVADQIQKDLSELIRNEVKDPRIGIVSVSEVEVSRDLAYAKVYVAELGADHEKNLQTVKTLNGAAGYLRKLLGQRMRLRLTPQLSFLHDNSFEKACQLSSLIDEAMASDSQSDTEEE